MFRLIDRYIFREIVTPFGLTLGALMLVLLTDQLLSLVELVVNKGVGLLTVFKVFISILPPFLVIAIPAAVLIGVIIAFNRLSSDNEIIALQANGISVYRLFKPAVLFSLCAFIATFSLSVWSQPWAGRSIRFLGEALLMDQVSVVLESGTFNEPFKNMVVYIEDIPAPNRLQGVLIYDLSDPEAPTLTVANKGSLFSDPEKDTLGFQLQNGNQYRFSKEEPDRIQQIQFRSYEFKLNLGASLKKARYGVSPTSASELRLAIQENPEEAARYRRLLEEYYKNFAFPFSCLIFGLLGVPAGMTFRRTGRLGGFALGLFLGTGYYFLLFVGDYLAASGRVPPVWAAWMPNLVMLLITVWIIKQSIHGTDLFRGWLDKA